MSFPPIIFCGPSGSGKDTLLNILVGEYKDIFEKIISHTTRAPRVGEVNGKDYHFTEKKQMEQEIADGLFFEHAQVHGNLYGLAKSSITKVMDSGKIGLLILDIQGVNILNQSGLNPFKIFIMPPEISVLRTRLEKRGDKEDIIIERLSKAQEEIDNYDIKLFDCMVVNDNLRPAHRILLDAIIQRYETVQFRETYESWEAKAIQGAWVDDIKRFDELFKLAQIYEPDDIDAEIDDNYAENFTLEEKKALITIFTDEAEWYVDHGIHDVDFFYKAQVKYLQKLVDTTKRQRLE